MRRAGPGRTRAFLRGLGSCAALAGLVPACGHDDGALRLVGTVERTLVEVSTPASETVVAIRVGLGDHVEAGQVLVHLDPILTEVEVTRAEAALAAARSTVAMARHDQERARELHAGRVTSEQALERANLAHDEAVASEREAAARLEAAEKRRRDMTLVAPVAGVVDQIAFDVGERPPAGAVLVVLLADGRPWVRVWLPEESFAKVGPGTPAVIHVDGLDGPLRGRVLEVAREPEFTPYYALTERDRVQLVYETRVAILDAPAALRPGLPAEVEIAPSAGPPPRAEAGEPAS